jgi:NADH dehydrogenase FAD-containing subunit/acyl-CoA reductase-like NAD-dependent aldehyde dehydrogenase
MMARTQPAVRVVCLGGGYVALRLVRALKPAIRAGDVEVTVISRDNFHTFHGFVGEMLAGRIQPGQIISPARRVFSPATFHHAEIEAIDVERKVVTTNRAIDGRPIAVPYDHLVIGLGARDDVERYPGLQEHAFVLRRYGDALRARNHLIGMMEMAAIETDPEERRRLLTVVVAGGNYGGVEIVTEIDEYLRQLTKHEFRSISADEIRVVLVHSGARILGELEARRPLLQRWAQRYVGSRTGVELRLHRRVVAATASDIVLDDGERIPSRTLISSTGTAASPLLAQLPFAKDDRGRLRTDEYVRVLDPSGTPVENVWAGGDCAAVPDPRGGTTPPLAIYAMATGWRIGRNVLRAVRQQAPQPYRFTELGDACSLGGRRAVAHVRGVPVTGVVAWVLWRAFLLYFVPSGGRRLRLLFDWLTTPVIGRDVAQLQHDEPRAVRKELFEPGQDIVVQGDVGRSLYIVTEGEAEVLKEDADGVPRRVDTIGPGDHIGELAVFQAVRRTATVRALTRVEVLSLGRDAATMLSRALPRVGTQLQGDPRRRAAVTAPLPGRLSALPAEQRVLLADYLEPVEFPVGARIFDAGDASNGCYVIDAGHVRLDVPLDEVDTETTIGYVESGGLLGELSLLDGTARSLTATAESDVRGRLLTPEALVQLQEEQPRLAVDVVRALGGEAADRLRTSTGRLAEYLAPEGTDREVEDMVARAKAAAEEFATWDEARVDALLGQIATAVAGRAEELARATVEATHIGDVADKALKNTVAALSVYERLQGQPAHGPMSGPSPEGVTPIAAPVGVVFAIVPMTNPIATAVFKTLSALKGRNALILSFHRVCLPLATALESIVHPVLAAAGAPDDLVQAVHSRAGRQRTARFMAHPDVGLVVATGGPGMVRAAYRSGTPAIGVGSGNAPTWIAADADPEDAAAKVVASKSFDNGLICGAEHNLVVDADVRAPFVAALESSGAAVLDADESARFLAAAVTDDGRAYRPEVLGQSAALLADAVGIHRPYPIKLLVVPAEPDFASALTSEKIGPFLSLFTVAGDEAAVDLSQALIRKMGRGHTAIVHTADRERAASFASVMPVSRILVNSPGTQGVFGLTTGLDPSLTLGCGTFGGNSTTDNVTWRNLVNVKRMAEYRDPAAVGQAD